MFIVVVIFYVWDMYTVVHLVYFGLRWLKNCESTLIIWWHFVQDACFRWRGTLVDRLDDHSFEFQCMFQSAVSQSGRCLVQFGQGAVFIVFCYPHRVLLRSWPRFMGRFLAREVFKIWLPTESFRNSHGNHPKFRYHWICRTRKFLKFRHSSEFEIYRYQNSKVLRLEFTTLNFK